MADRLLITDTAFAELAPFRTASESAINNVRAHPSQAVKDLMSSRATIVYDAPGWLGNAKRWVRCESTAAGYRLSVAEVGTFIISADGSLIARVLDEPGTPPEMVMQTVLGPAMILALAGRGTFCLHASAVALGDRVIAVLGESGTGKSTLAAYLDHGADGATDHEWYRLADDVLPVRMCTGGLEALPRFPQLKLEADRQPSLDRPERLPICALHVLDTGDPLVPRDVSLRKLSASETARALVRHTIAARLFAGTQLARHLRFCAEAATAAPGYRLSYPRTSPALKEVKFLLASDLAEKDGMLG